MTAQIGDRYRFEGENYTIITTSRKMNFNPKDYGLCTVPASTACRNGYWCKYKISAEGIYLDDLYVHCRDNNYPPVNGKNIERTKSGKPSIYMGFTFYKDLNLRLKYTGRILAGKDFIFDYYRHMGYQRYYSYKAVKEFVFEEGTLIAVNDHSGLAKRVRKYIEKKIAENPQEDIFLIRRSGMYSRGFIDEEIPKDESKKYWWL